MILTPAMRNPLGLTVASILSLVGMFFMRYDYVIAGQLVPVRGDMMETASELLHYAPSITEIGIIVGAFALCMFLYTLAEKVFDLEVRHVHLPEGVTVGALPEEELGVAHHH